jgi:hypothetical protein
MICSKNYQIVLSVFNGFRHDVLCPRLKILKGAWEFGLDVNLLNATSGGKLVPYRCPSANHPDYVGRM